MSEMNKCPECGAKLPTGTTEGLCPRCLMRAGLGSDDVVGEQNSGSPFAVTTPQSGGFVPPLPEEIAPHFPQFEILELLGHGGMGAVYKARQTKLDRLVALKIIRPESSNDPAFAERFMREARTLARLNHPNIVAVHDFGETGEMYYFVMEYVDGLNLRQLMQAGELQPEQTLAIVPQICEALQFAHDEGIIHRDIKPENILVDSRGKVKIADFGLAKLVRPLLTPGESPGAKYADFTLTGTHQVMGTPRYMAPEQMAGSHHVDHRADIYSLGVVFYEMLTGELPMGQFDPPSQKAAVDVRLDEVVLRALASDPQRRFQQAGEMKTSVERITSHPDDTIAFPTEIKVPQQPAGLSSIIEREAHNILRWVTGSDEETKDRQPRMPTLLMILMSLAGALMLFLPWLDLEIPGASLKKTYYGTDRWPAFTASVAFGCLAMMFIVFPAKRRMSIGRALVMTALAALAVLHVFLFKADLETGSIRPRRNPPAIVYNYRLSAQKSVKTEEPTASEISELLSRPLYQIEHHFTYREGFYGSLGLSLGMLLLSAIGIRHAIAAREESLPKPKRKIESESPRFSRKAILGACWAPLFIISVPLAFAPVGPPFGLQGPSPAWWQWLLALTIGPLGVMAPFATTILGIVALSDIRHSKGGLTGLGLAFFDAVFFPTLILNALMIVGPMVGLGMSKYISWALLVAVLFVILVDVFVLRLLWRSVTATEVDLTKTGEPTPVVLDTPKPKKRKRSGCFVLAIVLVSLVAFFLIIGSLLWLVSFSRVETPDTDAPRTLDAGTPPQDAMAQRRNWVLGPDGPALTDRFARNRELDPSQHQQVNKILQDIYREYLVLLEKQTQRSVNADGHQVTTVTPFPKEITKLEEKLWGRLDPLLNREQQNLFRLNLPLHPKRIRPGAGYSGGSIHDRGIFGFGDDVFQIEIWRVGEWFHWTVLDKAVLSGRYPPFSGPQKEPELPEAFRRWWKEPTEDSNQNDAPD